MPAKTTTRKRAVSERDLLIMEDGTEKRPCATNIVNWLAEPSRRRLGQEDAMAILRVVHGHPKRGDKARSKRALARLADPDQRRISKGHYEVLREYV